jgi:Protein of unknown function (DUF2721)
MIPGSVLHAIQLAVAPIFMLAAVAAMIGTVATRLARIIDRARELEERLESAAAKNPDAAYWELDRLKLRGRICNWSVGLLAVCGMLIGATVMVLFVGETSLPRTELIVPWTFLGAVGAFVLALLLFLTETLLATHALRFGKDLSRK